MYIPMLSAVEFLIIFPFVMGVLMWLMRRQSHLRSFVAGLGGFIIMAAAIVTSVSVLASSEGENNAFLIDATVPEHFIMGGEIFLFCIVCFLSIKYRKYYCILLAAAGTIPVLWMDFNGYAETELPHLRVDYLSAVMMLIVGIVGVLICIYACGYMQDYHEHHEDVKDRSNYFLGLLFIFLGAMFGLICSDNLGFIFFFWEITSVCSFLLIGYTGTDEAVNNSFRALWMNLLGGFGFAIGLMYCDMQLHIYTLYDLTRVNPEAGSLLLVPVTLFAFAALTKSAQFPVSRWLLGAMVAPTPSSALLHSATMVKIGVYMLIRLSPMLKGNLTGIMVTVIGGFKIGRAHV